MTRSTWVARDVRAGCHTCHGGDARWFHKGAQGTAAQHTDATGHEIRDAVAKEREACAELLELDAGMSSYVKLAAEIRERKTP